MYFKLSPQALKDLCYLLKNFADMKEHTILVSDFCKRVGHVGLVEQALENEAAQRLSWTPMPMPLPFPDMKPAAILTSEQLDNLVPLLDTCFIPEMKQIVDWCRSTDVFELEDLADDLMDQSYQNYRDEQDRVQERNRQLGI